MRPSYSEFGKAGAKVFRLDDITTADFSLIEELQATVTLRNGDVIVCQNIDALDLAHAIKPTAIEGRRLRYARHAWVVHNLVGHPVMQLLAFFKLYRWAIWVHDVTAPRAAGAKRKRGTDAAKSTTN